MQINVTYDSSVASAPAGFETAVNAAVQYLDSQFNAPITVNIDVGWGEVGGQAISSGAVGESDTGGYVLSYDEMRDALWANAVTPAALTAVENLPANDPTNGSGFFVSSAEAKALGLVDPNSTASDGSVGLSSSVQYTFDPNNRAVSGEYDAIGVLEHEITEVLGRTSSLGQPQNGINFFGPLDLFRYTAPGVLAPTSNTGSFSIDGQNLLKAFNNPTNGGDSGDWTSADSGDTFDAFVNTGTEAQFSNVDLTLMDVLGYHPVPPTPTTPTPTVAPMTTRSTPTRAPR